VRLTGGKTMSAAPQPNRQIAFSSTPEAARRFDQIATIAFWIALFLVLGYLFVKLFPLNQPDSLARAMKNDFGVFWAAGKLAFAGEPLAAFDADRLLGVAELAPDERPPNFRWAYPPAFQVLMMPFGAFSYTAAFPAFIVFSGLVYLLAVRAPASVLPGLWRLTLASPAVLIGTLTIGQTSVLWTAGLVAGLWAVRSGRPVAAGLFFALLTMKPQLGVLIPIALIASRQWAVIGWGAVFMIALSAAATAVVGVGYWGLLLGALDEASDRVASGTMILQMMPSPYGFMRAIGTEHGAALVPQIILTALTTGIIAWAWSKRQLGWDIKCATLCAGILLAMPYAFYYEGTLELAAAVFLIRDGFGRNLGGKAWLFLLWLGTAPPILFPMIVPTSIYMPPVIIGTMMICFVRAHRRLSSKDGEGAPAPAVSA
jgi:hypothetical protein